MRFLRRNTAVTVLIGLLIDWRDARTPLIDNDLFAAESVAARLIKGSTGSSLTLTKTGGSNNINLDGYGSATLTLTAGNVDTVGGLRVALLNAVVGGISSDLILPLMAAEFTVLSEAVYDALIAGSAALGVDLTTQAKADVNSQCDTAIADALLATEANATSNKNAVISAMPSVAGLASESNATANRDTITTAIANKEVTPVTDISSLATAANLALVKAKTDLIPASPAAVGSVMAIDTDTVDAIQAGLGTIGNQAAILSELDDLQAVSVPSVEDIVAALKAATGFTAGGAMTFAQVIKVIAGWAAGKARLKAGTTNTIEILDAENGTTVVLELTASESTPYKQVALK